MSNLDLDHQLNTMIIEGRSQDAFEKFYAEDVVVQENDQPERVGREQWMEARLAMEKTVKSYDARVLAYAANGDITFSEWDFIIDLEDMGSVHIVQVAVRRWKDGRVIRERFYHK